MKIFQWKWMFTRSKTCCTIWRPFWFAMAAIFNRKWTSKYKNPPIWAKLDSKQILVLRIDNCHGFWNWEPWGGVMSAIVLQWQFQLLLLSTADLRNYWTEFHETWWSYRYMILVGPKVFSFVVKGVKVILLGL